MNGKKKVVHIITGLTNGGAEAVLYRLCISDKRNEHVVISLMDQGFYGPKLLSAGIPVYTLDMPRGRITLHGCIKLWKLIRAQSPAVVQTWMYHADLLGGLVARLAGLSAVVWGVHHTVLEPGKSKRTTIMIARVLAKLSNFVPKYIAVCAKKSQSVHAALGYAAGKMVVVPNGYDLGNFVRNDQLRRTLRAEWDIPDEMPLLGMVSRYDPQKDHKNLIRALADLTASGKPFRCVLVGPGMTADNAELTREIGNAGLAQEVLLLGPRNDIPAVMSALDIHLLSSSAEAFPNVLAEAMACGTPCVTTDVGDAALIVGNTGWVVPPSQSAALADAIRVALTSLCGDDWHLRQAAARQRVEENFSLEKMIVAYDSIWQRASS